MLPPQLNPHFNRCDGIKNIKSWTELKEPPPPKGKQCVLLCARSAPHSTKIDSRGLKKISGIGFQVAPIIGTGKKILS